MSAVEFISSIAWPITVLAIAVIFRRPLTAALTGESGRMRAGPFELEWKGVVSNVEANLGRPPTIAAGKISGAAGKRDELALHSPNAAVAESYQRLETALRTLLKEGGVEVPKETRDVPALADLAAQHGFINPKTRHATEGLSVLRRLAAHGPTTELSTQRALEFVALTNAVLFAMHAGT